MSGKNINLWGVGYRLLKGTGEPRRELLKAVELNPQHGKDWATSAFWPPKWATPTEINRNNKDVAQFLEELAVLRRK